MTNDQIKELFIARPTNEEQNDFVVIIGKHLATEEHFRTKEEAEAYKENPKWDMIFALCAEMIDMNNEKNKNKVWG